MCILVYLFILIENQVGFSPIHCMLCCSQSSLLVYILAKTPGKVTSNYFFSINSTSIKLIVTILQDILNICIAAMVLHLATEKSNPTGTTFVHSLIASI